MIIFRARVAAGVGALVALFAAYPVVGWIQGAVHLRNLVFLPVLVAYLVGSIIAGGLAGLWLFRRLDWNRRGSYQCVGLIVGLVAGVNWFSGETWPGILYGAGVLGLIGVAGSSIYWVLDRIVREPVKPPYSP